MTGFPIRPLRPDFGPEPRNRYPVRNAEHETDGETVGRLMFHQLTGLGLVCDLAQLVVSTAALTASLAHREEAWNTRGASSGAYEPPALEMTTEGVFTIQYPTTVPDWSGVLQPLVFRGGAAYVLNNDDGVYQARVIPEAVPSSKVTVRVVKFDGGAWVESYAELLIVLR